MKHEIVIRFYHKTLKFGNFFKQSEYKTERNFLVKQTQIKVSVKQYIFYVLCVYHRD